MSEKRTVWERYTYLVPEHHIHHLKNDIYLLSLIVMNIFLIHIGYVWLLFLVDLCIVFVLFGTREGKEIERQRDRESYKKQHHVSKKLIAKGISHMIINSQSSRYYTVTTTTFLHNRRRGGNLYG